jgi:hypothetical protein
LQQQCTRCCWEIPKTFSQSKDSEERSIYWFSLNAVWHWLTSFWYVGFGFQRATWRYIPEDITLRTFLKRRSAVHVATLVHSWISLPLAQRKSTVSKRRWYSFSQAV